MPGPSRNRPDLRLRLVENKAETLSIAIRRRGEVFLKMSRASNNRCRFCNDAAFQDGTFWPFEAMAAMIDEGLARGVRRVFLSGGEPTIHPDFLKVVAYARRRGAEHVTCITNGRLFAYPELCDKAVRLGLTEAFVAVLGSDAATHDDLSQVAGSFAQTTEGVRNLVARGVRVHLSTVVNRKNLHQLADILGLVPGVTGLTAVRIAPAGRALWEALDELGFETEEARPHVERAFRRAAELGLDFVPKLFPASFYEGREASYTHHEEYLPEIKDTELRTGLFGTYARGAGEVACRGETCRVCFRRPYCDALYAFREALLAHGHAVVRCDLDDPRQCALLPALHRERRLWLRVRRADTVEARLAELGLAVEPWIVEADELGAGDAPACEHLLLCADATVGRAERLGRARRVGLVPVAGAEPDAALAAVASFVSVATHERYRDELARGLAAPRGATDRGLPVFGLPPCLAPQSVAPAEADDVLDLVAVATPTTLDVVGFTHFFLAHLDRDRSARCASCSEADGCPGLHVNHARRWGFGVLAPLGEPAER
ncbi:MAG: radical SAM protein [Polyangiaceae bacterium]|nr:radical SAM protein [Polyangiaceae bacterium]